MSINLSFVKLANKWFAVLPEFDGNVEELEMVCGADDMLEKMSDGKSIVTTLLSDQPFIEGKFVPEDYYILNLQVIDDCGATYYLTNVNFENSVWLCNVTKTVFEEFPENIYILKM